MRDEVDGLRDGCVMHGKIGAVRWGEERLMMSLFLQDYFLVGLMLWMGKGG